MPIREKPVDSITVDDLKRLIEEEVAENRYIEYKESLPGNSDSDKKEFLADISSFANASGGDLIYGIRAESGLPRGLVGVEIGNVEAEFLRLENMIRDGVEPRIIGTRILPIPVNGSKIVLLIRIPRSWAMPHMVTYKGHSRFFSRTSAGKYQLDVHELRAAFLASETVGERIRNFRRERVAKIIAGETPLAMREGGKIVLHIIPMNAFDPAAKYDTSLLQNRIEDLPPLYTDSWSSRHNFDGFLGYSGDGSYVQVFRNGIVEAVEARLLRITDDSGKIIRSVAYERAILQGLHKYMSIQRQLGVAPPLVIILTLTEVFGYTMAVNRSRFPFHDDYPIDRDVLLVDEVIVDNFESDAAKTMKPIFDAVWNATGWSRSMNYDQNGNWVGH